MTNSDIPILAIEDLRKEFGRVTALAGIDITLHKPGVYGFLGPNGAGKTTTFKLICGLLRPTSGRVVVDGTDVRFEPHVAVGKLGVLFDAPAYYPYLSGRENLQVFARWQGLITEQKIDSLLNLVGLDQAKNRRVGGYSWGMKQRLGLAAALLSDPKLVLLDEPTNGLDPGGIADVRRLLPKLAYEEGRTVLLSSHRMEEVEQICDAVTIIHQGRVVACGTPAELAAGEPEIMIRCADPAAARTILSRIVGIKSVSQVGPDRLKIGAPGLAASKVNQLLMENGVAVEEVMQRRESLEEVFFRLTGSQSHG